jgi:hypothetical protein
MQKGIVLLARICAALFVLALIAVVGAYWWSNIPPNRSPGLPADAVWLWGPAVGLPAPKRGTWLNCWIATNAGAPGQFHCKTTDKSGRQLYEGVFLPYKQEGLISQSELIIDTEQMQRNRQAVLVDGELVPIIYLKNGNILIPSAKYEDGKKLLSAP